MLNVTVEMAEGRVPVTIMRLDGELDASNYESVIAQTQALYAAGTRDLLVDLENLEFVSSSGLVGLHSMALVMRGDTLEDAEEGWGAIRAMSRDVIKANEPEKNFKLLKPQPLVGKVLDTSGFSDIFPVFDDEETAVSSFG